MREHSNLTARSGGPADEEMLLELFDQAVEWLLGRGQQGQWGGERPSGQADWRARVHGLVMDTDLRVLESQGKTVGALAVGEAPGYVSPPSVPERYIHLMLTARTHMGQGLGQELLGLAEEEARCAGAEQLRVDCWAGAPTLVSWYERMGFERCETFELRDWPGQILRRHVPHEDSKG